MDAEERFKAMKRSRELWVMIALFLALLVFGFLASRHDGHRAYNGPDVVCTYDGVGGSTICE